MNSSRCIFILSISSDIGRELALRYRNKGCSVIGTYRNRESIVELEGEPNIKLISCDIDNHESVARFAKEFSSLNVKWETFLSCVATELPIGNFFECDFATWTQSIHTNFINQLKILHQIHPFRTQPTANVVFFATSSTNNANPYYSALISSRFALIKMCELLDCENPDLNIFILGPGWVRTKIHQQTLDRPELSREHHAKVKAFVDSGAPGTPMERIFEHIEWQISCGKKVSSGRNFSTVYDAWGADELKRELISDPEMYKLRRFKNGWSPNS